MATTQSIVKKEYFILKYSTDWAYWYDQLRWYAAQRGVWQYIDPDSTKELVLDPFPAPDQLIEERYLSLLERYTRDLKAAEEAGSEPPIMPRKPVSTTDEEIDRLLQFELDKWTIKEKTYARLCTEYGNVVDLLHNTVDDSWLRIIAPNEDLRHTVVQLRKRIFVTKRQEEDDVRQAYRKAINSTNDRSVNPETWYKEWEFARRRGEEHKIPEVQGTLALTDFLTAAGRLLPGFASRWLTSIHGLEVADPERLPTLETLGLDFLSISRARKALPKVSAEAFAIQAQQSTESYDCPCIMPGNSRPHTFKPSQCEYVRKALLGKAFKRIRSPNDERLNACRENLEKPQWKDMVDTVKNNSQQQPQQQPEKKDDKKEEVWLGFSAFTVGLEGTHGPFSSAMLPPYPLRDSVLLSLESNVHVTNSRDRLTDFEPTCPGGTLYAGDTMDRVKGRGAMTFKFSLPTGEERTFTLKNALYIPDFHTSLASHNLLRKGGFWFDGWNGWIRHGEKGMKICQLMDKYDQHVIEYNELSS